MHRSHESVTSCLHLLTFLDENYIFFLLQIDPRYEITKDVRGQIKFLEELDKAEQKRHEEQEREMLMRAAKSRSKTEDPEQAKLKAKVQKIYKLIDSFLSIEINNNLHAIFRRKKCNGLKWKSYGSGMQI